MSALPRIMSGSAHRADMAWSARVLLIMTHSGHKLDCAVRQVGAEKAGFPTKSTLGLPRPWIVPREAAKLLPAGPRIGCGAMAGHRWLLPRWQADQPSEHGSSFEESPPSARPRPARAAAGLMSHGGEGGRALGRPARAAGTGIYGVPARTGRP